jgi:RNA-directed DNA polymerase
VKILPTMIIAFKSLKTIRDIARLLETTEKRLFFHLYSYKRLKYRTFHIPKASGGQRTIDAPPEVISMFQRILHQCISDFVPFKRPVHGFVRKRNVVSNASCHLGAKWILNIDLEDFFPSIHFGRVRGVFQKSPFSFPLNVSSVLAHICCHQSLLPQGGPSSPVIANLVCRRMDDELERFARSRSCIYTRYADDITISTNTPIFHTDILATHPSSPFVDPVLGGPLQRIIEKNNFKINPNKTRLRGRFQRQEVTGITVNEKINVPRKYVRNIRALIYDCEKRGFDAAEDRFRRKIVRSRTASLAHHLRGKLDYLRMIRGADDNLFLNYSFRADKVVPGVFSCIPIIGSAVREIKFISKALWVVIGKDAQGYVSSQGTAFSLKNFGIVTAGHVFNNPNGDVKSWELQEISHPHRTLLIDKIKRHQHIDLALIEGNYGGSGMFATGERKGDPIPQTPVFLCGFPQWRTIGDGVYCAATKVTQPKSMHGLNYFALQEQLREGMSGGPVFDQQGFVIGAIIYGNAGSLLPNSAINISHLSDVKATALFTL